MTFDSDTEFLIVLDSTDGSVNYNQDLEYLIDLAQRVDGAPKKDYVALQGGSGDTELNEQSGITNFKERNPLIGFIAYFDKRDKTNGTLQNAIDSGDFSLINLARFNQPSIRDVDTGADEISVDGDQTNRMKSGNTIVIDGSTGNDGIYTIDTISYDSGDDETDISLVESVSDGTVDGQVNDGAKTVVEQKVWLEEFVFDGRIGETYTLRGQEFSDSATGGRNVVLKQAGITRDVEQFGPFSGRGVIKTGEGLTVGR